jgi:hypothetical protein
MLRMLAKKAAPTAGLVFLLFLSAVEAKAYVDPGNRQGPTVSAGLLLLLLAFLAVVILLVILPTTIAGIATGTAWLRKVVGRFRGTRATNERPG